MTQVKVTISKLPPETIEDLEAHIVELHDEHDFDPDLMSTFNILLIGYDAAWEEIEYLRSQLALKDESLRSYEHNRKLLQAEKAQAEQERDELKAIIADHGPNGRNYTNEQYVAMHDLKQVADESMIAALSMADKFLEANTAMREALEWYANHTNYHPYRFMQENGRRASEVLSRYPKEGGQADESN